MSRQEIAWRIGTLTRIERDRIRAGVRAPRWDRGRLKDLLDPHLIDPVLLTHLDRGDWNGAQRMLGRALRARPRLFVLDPRSSLDLRHEIVKRWPQASAAASARADRIIAGRYDLLGYRNLTFNGPDGHIDWHADPVHQRRAPQTFWAEVPFLDPHVGDHKVIWELNRHQHWLSLGRALWLTRDRRYGWAIGSQLEAWMKDNPPLTGINWASALELGLRSLSWLWALHFLLADTTEGASGPAQSPWLVDMLLGLDRQLTHVEHNLSYYFSPNTHLTGEALALYVAGLSLPELAASSRWTATGRRILIDEIDRQIGADGGHAERSPHYHRYTLDFYLLALLMAERSRDIEAIARFTDAVTRLADFARTIADDNGRRPLIGDDDGGMLWPIAGRPCDDVRDSLALAAVVLARPDLAPWGVPEEVFWIAGRTAIEQEPFVEAHRVDAGPPPSRAFADTGYVVARDGRGDQLVFDVGPHGYLNGGHAHTDALSITLSLKGRTLLVDPGTSTYTMDTVLRDRMRSSASHNTITLDGQSPAAPAGPFKWQSRADARLDAVRHNPVFDWVEGSHNGYPHHLARRTVLRAPKGGWLIVDEILGRGRVTADLHWHFDPSWMVTTDIPTRVRATNFAGEEVWLVHDGSATAIFNGDESGLGWFAPAYGALVPTWSAKVTRAVTAPAAIVTWIAAAQDAPSVMRLAIECDPGGSPAIGLRVRQDDRTFDTLLRPGEAAARETRDGAMAGYHTDARLLHYGAHKGRFLSLAICDATHVLALREGWLSIAADSPFEDLYVEAVGDRLELWSSTPGHRVRLQGAVVNSAKMVRLNGRELRVDTDSDSLVATSSCWGDPGRITVCAALPVSRT